MWTATGGGSIGPGGSYRRGDKDSRRRQNAERISVSDRSRRPCHTNRDTHDFNRCQHRLCEYSKCCGGPHFSDDFLPAPFPKLSSCRTSPRYRGAVVELNEFACETASVARGGWRGECCGHCWTRFDY